MNFHLTCVQLLHYKLRSMITIHQLKFSVQESIMWWFWRIFSHSKLQDLWGLEFHLEMTLSFIPGLISVPIFTHEALDCVKFFWWFRDSLLSIIVCIWFSVLDDMPPLTKLLQPASQQALLLNHKQDNLLNLQNPYKPTSRMPSSAECQLKSWKDCAFEGEASSYHMINLSSRAIVDSAYDKVKLCMSTTQCRSQILIWTFLHMRIFVTMVLYYEPESPKGEKMCEWFHHAHHHLHWLHDLHIALSASSMSCTQCNIWKQGS